MIDHKTGLKMREIVVSVILYSLAHLYDDCVAYQPMGTKFPFQKSMHGDSIASLQRTINPSSRGSHSSVTESRPWDPFPLSLSPN